MKKRLQNRPMRCICFDKKGTRCPQPVAASSRRAGYYFCVDHNSGVVFLMCDAFSSSCQAFALDINNEDRH